MNKPRRLNKSKLGYIVAFLFVIFFTTISSVAADTHQLKVGIYDFKPLAFLDSQKKAQGFFIDILDSITRQEGWSIIYVYGSFEECLERMKKGEIDLLAPVAFSNDREEFCEFTNEYLFIIWAEIYKPQKSQIKTIQDLRDKKIAVVKGAQANNELANLLDGFGVKSKFFEYQNYPEVLNSIEKSDCDAGVFPNLFGFHLLETSNIEQTQIFFAPTKLKLAAGKSLNSDINKTLMVRETLDRYISKYKADNKSIYYDSYNKWINPQSKTKMFVPVWVYWTFFSLAFLTLIVIGFNWLLRRKIKIKTDDLILSNKQLHSKAAALIKIENHLKLALEAAKAGAWEWDLETNENTWSETLFQLYDLDSKTCKASYEAWQQTIVPRDRDLIETSVQDAVLKGSEINIEWQVNTKDGSPRWLMSRGQPRFDNKKQMTSYLGVVIDITEKKISEKALKREAGLLQAVMDGAKNSHLVYLDRDFNFVRVNETYAASCGYKPDEMTGKNHFALYPHPENEAIFTRVRDTGESYLVKDKPFKFPDQSERGLTYWDWTLSPVKDLSGQVTGLIFSLFETTERKRAEEELRDSLQTSADIVAAIPAGLFIYKFISPDRLILLNGNPEAEKLTGLKIDQWKGCEFNEIWPEARKTGITDQYLAVAKTGAPFETEDLYYEDERLSGAFRIRVFTLPEDRLAVAFENITKRKRAENALQESEEKYRLAIEASNDGLWDWDIAKNHVYYSPGWGRILGYENVEPVYDFWESKIHPDDKQSVLESFKKHLKGYTKQWRMEHRLKTSDGNWKWVLGRGRVEARDINGNPSRVVGTMSDISDQKQAENALQESEDRYRSLINFLPLALLVTQEERIMFVNPSAMNLFGVRNMDEIIGSSPNDWIHADFVKKAYQRRCHVLEMGKMLEPFEMCLVRKDGREIFVSANTSRITQDKKPATLSVFQDITERKQADDMLRKSEIRHSKMIANIGEVIVIIDEEGINRYKSPNIENLFGWKPKEVVGYSTWDNVHPDDIQITREYFERIAQKPGSVGTIECRYRCKDGSYKWIEFTGTNLFHDPDIRGLLGNYQDITERKNWEKELSDSEARFKTFHEASSGGIAIHDKGTILDCNKGLAEMTGYSHDELIGMDGLLLIAENSRALVMNNILSGYEKPYESMGLRKNGEEYPIRLQAQNIPYKGKNVRSVEFRDISEQKHADKERESLQTQLNQTQKMEAIGILAGGIAHDFNNILFPIIGISEMLLEDYPEEGPLREGMSQIYTSAIRAGNLVQQILTFSRQEKNELKLLIIQPIIKEALKLIRASIPTSISIHQNLDPNCGAVKADPTQIHQIVMNLATNAYHAMEETGGELKVNLKEVKLGQHDLINTDMAPGFYACLKIEDTGKGINKEIMDKIFDPFFTTKEKGKGTGMGLSVVHGIVKSMNGEIKVQSELGKGTEFQIFMPVIKSVSKKQEKSKNSLTPGGTERILLVDDEDPILKMEKQILERLGYHVSTRISSVEALEAFRSNPKKFDLVITDMSMPNMPGDKLAAELIKIRPDIPILICTGFSETLTEERIESIGIKGLLMKPMTIKDLAPMLRDVLDKKDE